MKTIFKSIIVTILISTIIGTISPTLVHAKEVSNNQAQNEQSDEDKRCREIANWDIPEAEKSDRTKTLEKYSTSGLVDSTLGSVLKEKKCPEAEATLITDLTKEAIGAIPVVGQISTFSDLLIHSSRFDDAKSDKDKALQAVVCTSITQDLIVSALPSGTAIVGTKGVFLSLSRYTLKKVFHL